MPIEVRSATEATQIAMKFIRNYRMIASPIKAVRDNDTWLVKIDVGPLFKTEASVKIDAKSGEVLEYDIP